MNIKNSITAALTFGLILATSPVAMAQDIHPEAMGAGKGAVFTERVVDVHIYAGAYGTPLIVDAVRGIQAALPARGPRFRIKTHGLTDCGKVANQKFKRATITFCEVGPNDEWAGVTGLRAEHHVIQNRAWIRAQWYEYEDFDRNTACHELMHAVSWVNDDYAADKDSCVHGDNPHPGSWDVRYLKKVYKKWDSKKWDRKHGGKR